MIIVLGFYKNTSPNRYAIYEYLMTAIFMTRFAVNIDDYSGYSYIEVSKIMHGLVNSFILFSLCFVVAADGLYPYLPRWRHSHCSIRTRTAMQPRGLWAEKSHGYTKHWRHYSEVIMSAMMSKITSLTIVYSIVYSSRDQRKHQSSPSLAFVRWIHRWPAQMASTRKMFPFVDVIMGITNTEATTNIVCAYFKGFTVSLDNINEIALLWYAKIIDVYHICDNTSN